MGSSESARKSSGVFQDVINSIFEPGVNHGVLVVMNCAFIGLFLILFYLLVATGFNLHVCALTAIAVLLFASIQWFIRELASSKVLAKKSPASSRPSSSHKKKKL
ncbi:hypothetical protein DL89DRAFT_293329 [Linderina pennispora]|uniref:Uncharacterized protein n=1 Tax=Linderina pennispora TaxID=61395 RepID=A0A1Y1W866_9FUNG|nr:uncharacterized protein DL89DRAFT_293329 [Linderina pennispora]ORX69717.1 hypothetical protein DL89DRAFT_293329 [Linderina pennispora]